MYCAEQVYPGMRFRNYALLGDDIVIGDARVADVYKDVIQRLGVKISLPKSLVSDIGGLEFAKKFRILDRDLSSISVKMIRSARHSIAWMPVLKQFSCTSLQISLRIRGADFRRYSMKPEHVNPKYNRHGYRHIIVAFSPGRIIPLPFQVWLGFPEGILITCYHMVMIRKMLVDACALTFFGLQGVRTRS